MGNDLSTTRRDQNGKVWFKGLEDGDHWCLCALRWRQANQVGKAPKLHLDSTHKKAL